jgi:TonB family protein
MVDKERGRNRGMIVLKAGAFGIPFISSLLIHGLVILLGSFFIHHSNLHRQELLPINLVELPRPVIPAPQKEIETPPETRTTPAPPEHKVEKPKPPVAKPVIVKPEPPAPLPAAPIKEEPLKAVETKTAAPVMTAPAPAGASGARIEGGGSEAGAGNLFGKGDVGVVPGRGTGGGKGGTAASGLGRGSGAAGLPAQTAPLRTNREAKPIQTVRAAYPPMALRAGLESDVTLKIAVDSQGNVTKAEITKSGGAGFDEEALKAVKQARFEPAQRDGQNVPAEFTFIYRFRLQR